MWDVIYSFIDQVGTFIGIIGAIISFLVWLKVKRQGKKLVELASTLKPLNNYDELKEIFRERNTGRPKAFCLSLIPTDMSIKSRVEKFLNSQDKKMPIVELNMDGLSSQTFGDFINEVKKKRRGELSDATEIHVFIQGPVVAGAVIGAVFDHWVPINLYHYNTKSFTYEYWGPLIKNI